MEAAMTKRVFNFNPGPATLPLSVLEEIRDELLDCRGAGMGVMEMSHRSAEYSAIHAQTKASLRRLLEIGDEYEILFLGGGASTQFYTVPWNFLNIAKQADYVLTGVWAANAAVEAARFGKIHYAYDAKTPQGYLRVPTQDELSLSPDAVYLHVTTNNTIAGTQLHHTLRPENPDAFVVGDMSSDMLWRKFDVRDYGLIYAGVQKNLGPAGATLVILRRDLLERCQPDLPVMARYRTHVESDSLFNTAPVFPIYVVGKVLAWLESIGGLGEMERRNRAKADLLYQTLDANPDFFRTPVERTSRSVMNVVWRLPTTELESRFVKLADQNGLVGLKGHRSVGGLRASLYNAMTLEGVEALVSLLESFAANQRS